MNHQVNLYQREFWPRRLLVSCRQVAVLWMVTLATCASISLYFHNGVTLADADVDELKLTNSMLNAGINNLTDVLENRSRDHQLAQDNERLKDRLKQRSDLATFLDGRTLSSQGNTQLSGLMSGFARQAGDGIWLARIHIGQAEELRLRGYVAEANQIPAYLERLGEDPAFNGRFFRSLDVKAAVVAGRDLLSFQLSSRPAAAEPEPEPDEALTVSLR